MLAEWAAAKLGITGDALDDYIKAVRKADLAEKGDDDVLRKVKQDFAEKGVDGLGRRDQGQDGRVPRQGRAATSSRLAELSAFANFKGGAVTRRRLLRALPEKCAAVFR